MSLWIKICGNTSLEDARSAVEAGADAVGFVFARSPRRVTRELVAAIVPHLPATVEKIGVFVDAALDEIVATVQHSGLTGVQLHWEAEPELPARLHERLGPELRILRVIHFSAVSAAQHAARSAAMGGTGLAYDWEKAGQTLFQNAREHRLIAAGGLKPENVAEAIRALRPWGVDAVTGVEAAPGRKDHARVREFIRLARSVR
jgi:phosphoribosylanthranilate isomerase